MKAKAKLQVGQSKKAQTSVREDYDLLVLGSGEGGKYVAWTLASQGLKTAVIERKYVGGSCPNIACLPSKNVIHSAKVASYFFRSHEFGISKDNCRISMADVRERKRKMVEGLVQMHLANYKASDADENLFRLPRAGQRSRFRFHPILTLASKSETIKPKEIQL